MATLYYADKVASTVMAKAGLGVTACFSTYELTGALVVNDVIQMCKIPAEAVILDVTMSYDDLDTGTTPALVLEVGDDGDVDRFIDGGTGGQATGLSRMNTVDGHMHQYSAANTIDVKATTGPATGAAAGTINVTVLYTMDNA